MQPYETNVLGLWKPENIRKLRELFNPSEVVLFITDLHAGCDRARCYDGFTMLEGKVAL